MVACLLHGPLGSLLVTIFSLWSAYLCDPVCLLLTVVQECACMCVSVRMNDGVNIRMNVRMSVRMSVRVSVRVNIRI